MCHFYIKKNVLTFSLSLKRNVLRVIFRKNTVGDHDRRIIFWKIYKLSSFYSIFFYIIFTMSLEIAYIVSINILSRVDFPVDGFPVIIIPYLNWINFKKCKHFSINYFLTLIFISIQVNSISSINSI